MATSASNHSALPRIECWCTLRNSTQKHNCLSPQMVNIVHNLLTNYSLSCSTSISLEEWRFPSGPGAFPNSPATHQSSQRFLCMQGVFRANQVNDHLTAQGTWQEPITALTGSSRPEHAGWESPVRNIALVPLLSLPTSLWGFQLISLSLSSRQWGVHWKKGRAACGYPEGVDWNLDSPRSLLIGLMLQHYQRKDFN